MPEPGKLGDAIADYVSPWDGVRADLQRYLEGDEETRTRLAEDHAQRLQAYREDLHRERRRRLPPILDGAPDSLQAWRITDEAGLCEDGTTWREAMKALRRTVGEWAADWGATRKASPWLLLLGPPGAGKTELCRILARHAAIAGNWTVRWAYFPDLLTRLKATRSPRATEHYEDVLEGYAGSDLLVLDDVRLHFGTDDDENICDRLIKGRHGKDFGRRPRPTWITTNLTLEGLVDVVGTPAWDRIREHAHIASCEWPSFRGGGPDGRP